MMRKSDVLAYQRKAPGRVRMKTPPWCVPPEANPAVLTIVTVQIPPEQEERLDQKLHEIWAAGAHCFCGTTARYIARDQQHPEEVQVILVWRGASMPPEEERKAALAALCEDLSGIIVWETASSKDMRCSLLA